MGDKEDTNSDLIVKVASESFSVTVVHHDCIPLNPL
jgi:hypothetical protein